MPINCYEMAPHGYSTDGYQVSLLLLRKPSQVGLLAPTSRKRNPGPEVEFLLRRSSLL